MLRRIAFAALITVALGTLVALVALGVTVYQWDVSVSERFRTHRWRFPSKIYADEFVLYPGMDIDAVSLRDRLHDRGYHATTAAARRGDYTATASHLDIYLHAPPVAVAGPRPDRVRLRLEAGTIVRIEDLGSGGNLPRVDLEPPVLGGLYQGDWEERRLVTLDDVPPVLVQAILTTEDRRFYDHHGVDVTGIARAMWVNLRRGHLAQGGSTLTQQLMKNFFLTEERTLRRKLTEAAMALVVERRFSKQEILENYLNEIYLGQRGSQAIHGVWEAARFYFATEPRDLSIGEAALLAGLIRAPNRYSPFHDAAGARQRRTDVLATMRAAGDISAAEFETAVAEPLRQTAPRPQGNDAPYFLDVVRTELAQGYPPDVLTGEGLHVFTALDTRLQQLAERSLRGGLADLERRYPRLRSTEPGGPLQGCLIAIQPNTGAIKAMMGGRDYASTQFNRCTQAARQPGSVFKPFTYLAAFETTRHSDAPIRPTTWIEDEPFSWPYDRQVWTPANYRKEYLGRVTVRTALEQSLNAATARVAQRVGLEPILDVARRMGIHSSLPAYPSVVLGAAEVSPFEVAQAFAVLANGGVRAAPQAIKKVTDRGGLPVERNPVQIEQVVPADTAYLVTHLLEGVMDAGTGRPARAAGFARPAAGKTGTTNDYGDAWFVGFTPDLLVVVWVGFDHPHPRQLSGGQADLPIWTDFMKQATAGVAPTSFVPPPGVTLVRIDPTSGALATPNCPHALEEAFYAGDEPTTPCPLHGAGAEDRGAAP